ncbi:hypothetical protein C2E23DRAFT_2575 [Lenzites betulinus]|nr:hypothetical protein C2E23DRAFT_2575 [Lenzites betulinus]
MPLSGVDKPAITTGITSTLSSPSALSSPEDAILTHMPLTRAAPESKDTLKPKARKPRAWPPTAVEKLAKWKYARDWLMITPGGTLEVFEEHYKYDFTDYGRWRISAPQAMRFPYRETTLFSRYNLLWATPTRQELLRITITLCQRYTTANSWLYIPERMS